MDLIAVGLLAAFDISKLGATALSWLWVAIGLGFVIFFHELGHFAVAKWCGVFVERFSIGFGPILWSFKRRHRIRPLGDSVRRVCEDARPGRHGPQPAHHRGNRR